MELDRHTRQGPLVLVHTEDPPGSGRARCDGLLMPVDSAAGRYPRVACPACSRDGRSYDDGKRDGWEQLRAILAGAAISWRTKEGRATLDELLANLPAGPR